MDTNHKRLSTVDALRLLGELEHCRFHLIQSAINGEEDESFNRVVLASQCQTARRKLQKKYFADVPEKDWCVVKSAATMLQILTELGNGDVESMKEVQNIIDSAIEIATGEDISGCESCRQDKSSVE